MRRPLATDPGATAWRRKPSCYGSRRTAARPGALFDDFIRPCEQGLRHVETEILRRLEIDEQFEFGRKLDWQLRGLSTLQDEIDVSCSAPEQVRRIVAERC